MRSKVVPILLAASVALPAVMLGSPSQAAPSVRGTEIVDTSHTPATIKAISMVSGVDNVLGTLVSTGGVIYARQKSIVALDGTGSKINIPVPKTMSIIVDGKRVNSKYLAPTFNSYTCISVPDPSRAGQYVKRSTGYQYETNVDFLSETPCGKPIVFAKPGEKEPKPSKTVPKDSYNIGWGPFKPVAEKGTKNTLFQTDTYNAIVNMDNAMRDIYVEAEENAGAGSMVSVIKGEITLFDASGEPLGLVGELNAGDRFTVNGVKVGRKPVLVYKQKICLSTPDPSMKGQYVKGVTVVKDGRTEDKITVSRTPC